MADDERPVAESPKAEKKQAGREKLIVGGTLALVVLSYLIYRRSSSKPAAAQGYPLGYGAAGGGSGGGDSGGGGSSGAGAGLGGGGSVPFPVFTGDTVDPWAPWMPTPSSPALSGSIPANQTPGPGTGPMFSTQPVPMAPQPYTDPSWATLAVNNQPAALASVFGATPAGDVSVYPTTSPVGSVQAPAGGVFSYGQWNGNQLVSGTYRLPDGSYKTVNA